MITDLGPSAEQIQSMRRNVMKHVEDRSLSRERTRRPRRVSAQRIGLIALGAGVLAAALVVTSVIMPGGTKVGTAANAAEFLGTAAVTTLHSSDPTPGPGQYLRVSTNAVDLVDATPQGSTTTLAWLDPSTIVVYIPADRSGKWIQERHNLRPTTFFGDSEKLAMQNFEGIQKSPAMEGIIRENGGAFYETLAPGQKVAQEYDVEKLPRDPGALRDYFYNSYVGGSASIDENVWKRMTELLRTPGLSAGLRAPLYKAMALVPGVKIIDSDVNVNGHTGVALGRTDPARPSMSLEVIIDPSTGLLIGERMVNLVKDGAIPAGTNISWTAIETDVVDSAP